MGNKKWLFLLLGLVVIGAFMTIETFFPDTNYKYIVYAVLLVAVLYIAAKIKTRSDLANGNMHAFILVMFLFTLGYHLLLINWTHQAFFQNDYLIFLCLIYLLVWVRYSFANKRR
ncbi:hypothetical protein [Paenibacillus sp. J22TS3]|uniref:hypothetical protein n=1 Tax=Paenibacillus sp. J22TS3 TaxID=2807192 RepID=UPI001B03FA2C|nr:hypothetical protein [Paenibacillus sp. J22TS3]GIP24324.1 hypothetical protein J22TS3_45990 [Paenibacillus sp. J22TS3]